MRNLLMQQEPHLARISEETMRTLERARAVLFDDVADETGRQT